MHSGPSKTRPKGSDCPSQPVADHRPSRFPRIVDQPKAIDPGSTLKRGVQFSVGWKSLLLMRCPNYLRHHRQTVNTNQSYHTNDGVFQFIVTIVVSNHDNVFALFYVCYLTSTSLLPARRLRMSMTSEVKMVIHTTKT